ncbi:endonuclease/exonuclease/phosphatase family protein [Gimesia sp.]|uniref:endonuclease/exonuclease/phosphatase family protein n=1 Tax=Gimesia sp. TaxID=2024833 RepID=UPI0032EE5E20
MKIVVWNTAWAVPGSKRWLLLSERIQQQLPDVICLTEAKTGLLPQQGHVIESAPDYGYPLKPGRRKVILWSKLPWSEVSIHENLDFPSGRIVSGITQGIRLVGVCIPWSAAHVTGGRKDRKNWEDHLLYLDALKQLVKELDHNIPLTIIGDYNQRLPRSTQPKYAYEKLNDLLSSGLTVHTVGNLGPEGVQLIDHIATSEDLQVHDLTVLDRETTEGDRLSDHFGIAGFIKPSKLKRE